MTSLQGKVESLTTMNALMKEDLTISRSNMQKTLAENKRLAEELDKFREEKEKEDAKSETGSCSNKVRVLWSPS